MNSKRLYDLINMDSAEGILHETETVLQIVYPGVDTDPVIKVFHDTMSLYAGKYPGYQACSTGYHDFQHCAETLLAMIRLIHGASVEGLLLSGTAVKLGLIAALLHDTGYIQEKNEAVSAGGKHTAAHVRRSMNFAGHYGRQHGFAPDDITACQTMIRCTDLDADFDALVWPSRDVELLGKMLAAADLLAQMADRAHLEKLFYLYQEFQEGLVSGYNSAEDLLRKTMDFHSIADDRFKNKLENTDRFMAAHFMQRWGIENDLYRLAIDNEKAYLHTIIRHKDQDISSRLRRRGNVKKTHSDKED
jgi:hypothetical protein